MSILKMGYSDKHRIEAFEKHLKGVLALRN